MRASKRKYAIEINDPGTRAKHSYRYKFGQTDDIQLELFKGGTRTVMSLQSDKTPAELGTTSHHHYSDALYKATLAYALCYGSLLGPKTITVSVDDEEEAVVFDASRGDRPHFLAAAPNDAVLDFPEEFRSDAVMEEILGMPKSKGESRIAALTALIIAKTKREGAYVTDANERFVHLWIAMNGYYNFINKRTNEITGGSKTSDTDAIKRCLRYHALGDRPISQAHRPAFAAKAAGIICAYDRELPASPFSDPDFTTRFDDLMDEIRRLDQNYRNLTLEGFLTFCLPYHYRCALIHGNRPMPIFVHSSDQRHATMIALSAILESFLDANLWKLFDRNHIDGDLTPRLERLYSPNRNA